jgi:predicted Fe-Mo cluster-binding NifX family protein
MAYKMLLIEFKRRRMQMKTALCVWQDRISPVFDSAQMLLIAEIERKKITGRRYEAMPFNSPSSRALKIFNLGVDVLICGAISRLYADMIEAYNIHLIPFVAGNSEQVLNAYVKNALPAPEFQMPGCGIKRLSELKH